MCRLFILPHTEAIGTPFDGGETEGGETVFHGGVQIGMDVIEDPIAAETGTRDKKSMARETAGTVCSASIWTKL